MRSKAILWIAGAFVLATGLAQTASATNTNCTTVPPADGGKATIQPGVVDGDLNTAESGKFVFTSVMNCGSAGTQTVCSEGTLTNASCTQNNHTGTYRVCTGTNTCTATLGPSGGTVSLCSAGSVQRVASSFKGSCLLANCTGTENTGGADLSYDLDFSQQTSLDALQKCPNNDGSCEADNAGPIPGLGGGQCSLTNATFGGELKFTE